MKRSTLVLFLACACGAGHEIPSPQPGVDAAPPSATTTAPTTCTPDETPPGLWGCDTVAAMQLSDLKLVQWLPGQPAQLQVTVTNLSNKFLNYPGIRIEASSGATGGDQFYGMWACNVEQLPFSIDTQAASGQRVTFTASAKYLDDSCPTASLQLTATAP
jgi:hypothetical protein